MIPQQTTELLQDVTFQTQPTYTYELNLVNENVAGDCQGLTAMEQAIYKILNTERYHNAIYSWNYGVELSDLYGKPKTYCTPEIERRIKEALLQDDRISRVYDFVFDYPKHGIIHVSFKIDTIEGTIETGKEVRV